MKRVLLQLQSVSVNGKVLLKSVLFFLFFTILLPLFGEESYENKESLSIQSIQVEGLKKTKRETILKIVSFQEGERVTTDSLDSKIEWSIQELKNYVLWYNISIEYTVEDSSQQVNLTISLDEMWTFWPKVWIEYSSNQGVSLVAGVKENNFWGTSATASANAGYNPYSSFGNIEYENELLTKRNRLSIGLEYEYYKDILYSSRGDITYQAQRGRGFGFLTVGTFLNEEKTLLLSLGTSVTIDKGLWEETNQPNKPFEDTLYWLIDSEFQFGKINRDNYLRTGYLLNLMFSVSPIPGIYPEVAGSAQWNHFIDLGGRSRNLWLKKTYIGYQFYGFVRKEDHLIFNDLMLYGINWGEVQGNYGGVLNIEFRPYLTSFTLLTPFELYLPLYLDVGYAGSWDTPYNRNQFTATAGISLSLAPKRLSSDLRINTGVNITKAANRQSDWFYWGIVFSSRMGDR